MENLTKEKPNKEGSTKQMLHKDMFGDAASERARFRAKTDAMIAAGQPIYIQLGFGRHPIPDFLNIDYRYRVLENTQSADFHGHTFIFDWPKGIPLPSDSVDFIFHEDMYEHLNQKEQYYMLTETLRILKPGRFHRINAPNLEFIMATYSNFAAGLEGIHDEWTKWHHSAVPTPASLEEQATIVGYRKVHFNGKGKTISGVKFRERRPGNDLDQAHYNIHADLEK